MFIIMLRRCSLMTYLVLLLFFTLRVSGLSIKSSNERKITSTKSSPLSLKGLNWKRGISGEDEIRGHVNDGIIHLRYVLAHRNRDRLFLLYDTFDEMSQDLQTQEYISFVKRNPERNIHEKIGEMCPNNVDIRDCYNGLMNLWMRYLMNRNIV